MLSADNPVMRSGGPPRSGILPLIGLAGAFLTAAWLIGVGLVDDAYIFLRYARNVSEGLGVVFNHGERVEGFTSPLWLALTVSLFGLTAEPSNVLMVFGGLVGLATVFLVNGARSLPGALALATSPPFVFWSFAGLETPLVSILWLATFLLVTQPGTVSTRRLTASGLTFALAALTRLETLAFAPLLGIQLHTKLKGEVGALSKAALCYGALLSLPAVYAAWRRSYYGDWLPNTYYAKAAEPMMSRLAEGAPYVLQACLWLTPFAAMLLLARTISKRAAVCAGWWLLVVASLGGDHFAFARFIVPVLPILAVLGASAFQDQPRRRFLTAGSVIVINVFLLSLTGDLERGRSEVVMARGWSYTGQWASVHLPPNWTIAAPAVGALPYYARHPTIDLLGLTDATVGKKGFIHRDGHPGHRRYHTDYVLERSPTLIILPWSGRYRQQVVMNADWPVLGREDSQYFHALVDLLERPETRASYAYRAMPLPNGTYLEALWRRTVLSSLSAGAQLGAESALAALNSRQRALRSSCCLE